MGERLPGDPPTVPRGDVQPQRRRLRGVAGSRTRSWWCSSYGARHRAGQDESPARERGPRLLSRQRLRGCVPSRERALTPRLRCVARTRKRSRTSVSDRTRRSELARELAAPSIRERDARRGQGHAHANGTIKVTGRRARSHHAGREQTRVTPVKVCRLGKSTKPAENTGHPCPTRAAADPYASTQDD